MAFRPPPLLVPALTRVVVVVTLFAAVLLGLTVPANARAVDAGGRPAGAAGLTVFRVDVSRYPEVGLVITVPGTRAPLPGRDFIVVIGTREAHPAVRPLSPDDVQLVLALGTGLPAAAYQAQERAAAVFVAGLPTGVQTAAVNPALRTVLPRGMTRDPAASLAEVASLTDRVNSTGSSRLAVALSAFSPGPHVRRTVVLVVSGHQSLVPAAETRFRRQLAASGTALYVLDATARGAGAFDSLAAGSGGFAVRIHGPGDWSLAMSEMASDLARQYYLRFTDTAPIPGAITVAAWVDSRARSVALQLPAANPVAPPPLPVARPLTEPRSWDRPLVWLAALLIVLGVSYGLGMLVASRREPARGRSRGKQAPEVSSGPRAGDELFFVFMMPCLNEEKVILNSLQRLLDIPGDDFVILVVDDGSDDNTAGVVSGAGSDRVWLLSRKPPQARQGKGEALNAAVRYLAGSGHLAGRDPDRVVVVVVDADGRLDPHAIDQVRPYFADPSIGAVQIGVRINNRQHSWLARMQDMEFVIYTEVFQRGRRHLGSVGLGGNGQFMRLSAMQSLGSSPWTRSLTDDLDLGVRLIAAGWRNEYCSAAAVHQQGVIELRRLLRQRSRWFQGHLQSWNLIPLVLRSAPRRARSDLVYHLSSPAVLLIASLLTASFLVSVINSAILALQGQNPVGWWIASTYALTFGPALIFSSVYWTRERGQGLGPLRLICFAHLYVCYGMMWYASGWWAVGRTLRGRTGWAKTDRVAEAPAAALPSALASASQRAVVVLAADPVAPQEPSPPIVPAPAARPSVARPSVARPPAVRPRVRRRRLAVTLAAVALSGVICAAIAADEGGPFGQGPWVTVFTGYGWTSIHGSGPTLAVTLEPARTRGIDITHSALVISSRFYADFVATVRVRTTMQLRQGAAGSPNAWEVGWVVWHYTSNERFYALTLEPTGWVLSKQDPAYPGGQRFLASGITPFFRVGYPHTVGIVQIANQITLTADGKVLTRFTDEQRPYLDGAFGFYAEDSQAHFDRILLYQLPAPST
jgi:1,2-diacylglycerol 3-beta-glucosyltransferase